MQFLPACGEGDHSLCEWWRGLAVYANAAAGEKPPPSRADARATSPQAGRSWAAPASLADMTSSRDFPVDVSRWRSDDAGEVLRRTASPRLA